MVGSFNFVGETTTIYAESAGNALANSIVLRGRATTRVGAEMRSLLVVAKLVPRCGDAADVAMARREIHVFHEFCNAHPNLLPILFASETETEIISLSPYAPGGDLHALTCIAGDTFKCLVEAEGRALTSQLLAGLIALHNKQFLHGDIKPQNVFLTMVSDKYVAQIGDFGLTRCVPPGADAVVSEGGTTGYMAPEMVGHIDGQLRPMVTFAIDLFALGVIIYQLLSGMSPFYPPSNVQAALEFDDVCWDPLAPEAREFVTLLLAKDPKERGTAACAHCHVWLLADAAAQQGKKRLGCAPQPDVNLHFHSTPGVQQLTSSGSAPPAMMPIASNSKLCNASCSDLGEIE